MHRGIWGGQSIRVRVCWRDKLWVNIQFDDVPRRPVGPVAMKCSASFCDTGVDAPGACQLDDCDRRRTSQGDGLATASHRGAWPASCQLPPGSRKPGEPVLFALYRAPPLWMSVRTSFIPRRHYAVCVLVLYIVRVPVRRQSLYSFPLPPIQYLTFPPRVQPRSLPSAPQCVQPHYHRRHPQPSR